MANIVRALVLLLSCLHIAECAIDSYEFLSLTRKKLSDGQVNYLHMMLGDTFGFNSGGLVEYSLDCNSTNTGLIALWVLTAGQKVQLSSDAAEVACEPLTSARAVENADAVVIIDSSSASHANGRVQQRSYIDINNDDGMKPGFYYFYIRECIPPAERFSAQSRFPASCKVTLNVTNSGGEHLSSDDIPIPDVCDAYIIMWCTVLALWVLNWGLHFRKTSPFHDIMFLGPVCHVASLFFEKQFYEDFSENGMKTKKVEDLAALMRMLAASLLFFVTMLASHGWCILRYDISQGNRLSILGLPPLFLLSMVTTRWVHRYFLATSIITAVIMVIYILKEGGRVLHDLRMRYSEIVTFVTSRDPSLEIDKLLEPLISKRFLISTIRLAFVGYALSWAFFGILAVYLDEHHYIEFNLEELSVFLTWLAILWAFRARGSYQAASSNQTSSNTDEEEDQPQCILLDAPGRGTTDVGIPVNFEQFLEYIASIKAERAHR